VKLHRLHELFMGPEARFIGAARRDEESREQYRAWLADRGDERADLFAIEDVLLRDDLTGPEREHAIARAQEILANSELTRQWWTVVTRTAPIRNCGSAGDVRAPVRFAFECPRTWETLGATSDPSARHCTTCAKLVYLCRSREEAEERARRGDCITIDADSWTQISQRFVSSCTGRPDPIAMWAERVFPDEHHDE
jgi:hypothetical protein